MKKWKLYTILFLLLFSSISFMFTLKSYAVQVNDGNYYFTDRMKNSIIDHFYGTNFNYNFYPRRDNNDSIDVKYFLYKTDDMNHFEGYAYICKYKKDNAGSVLEFPSCGIGLNKNAGRYNVMFRSPHIVRFMFNKDDKDVYDLRNIGGSREGILTSFSDSDFDNGLKVYGDVLFDDWKKPVVNKLKELDEPKNNNSSSDKKDKKEDGIIAFISSFFKPLIDSLGKFKDFIGNFFNKLGEVVKSWFIPSQEYLDGYLTRVKEKILSPFEPLKVFTSVRENILGSLSTLNLTSGGSTLYFPSYSDFYRGDGINKDMGINNYDNVYHRNNIYIDLNHIPKPLLYLARVLLNIAVFYLFIDTALSTASIILGDRKIWNNKEDKEE